MRQGSLFARLRGKDGRSLARALVVLVLLSLFAGGLNAGAAAGGDAAFCLVNDAKAKAPAPAHEHKPDCCILGPTPFGSTLLSSPPPAVMPDAGEAAITWPVAVAAISGMTIGRATARGPPLDV
jgi:hypothetical protein